MAAAYGAVSSTLTPTADTGALAVRLAVGVLGAALVYAAALLALWRLSGMPAGPERVILSRLARPSPVRQGN
jgi:hypothetical protein